MKVMGTKTTLVLTHFYCTDLCLQRVIFVQQKNTGLKRYEGE